MADEESSRRRCSTRRSVEAVPGRQPGTCLDRRDRHVGPQPRPRAAPAGADRPAGAVRRPGHRRADGAHPAPALRPERDQTRRRHARPVRGRHASPDRRPPPLGDARRTHAGSPHRAARRHGQPARPAPAARPLGRAAHRDGERTQHGRTCGGGCWKPTGPRRYRSPSGRPARRRRPTPRRSASPSPPASSPARSAARQCGRACTTPSATASPSTTRSTTSPRWRPNGRARRRRRLRGRRLVPGPGERPDRQRPQRRQPRRAARLAALAAAPRLGRRPLPGGVQRVARRPARPARPRGRGPLRAQARIATLRTRGARRGARRRTAVHPGRARAHRGERHRRLVALRHRRRGSSTSPRRGTCARSLLHGAVYGVPVSSTPPVDRRPRPTACGWPSASTTATCSPPSPASPVRPRIAAATPSGCSTRSPPSGSTASARPRAIAEIDEFEHARAFTSLPAGSAGTDRFLQTRRAGSRRRQSARRSWPTCGRHRVPAFPPRRAHAGRVATGGREAPGGQPPPAERASRQRGLQAEISLRLRQARPRRGRPSPTSRPPVAAASRSPCRRPRPASSTARRSGTRSPTTRWSPCRAPVAACATPTTGGPPPTASSPAAGPPRWWPRTQGVISGSRADRHARQRVGPARGAVARPRGRRSTTRTTPPGWRPPRHRSSAPPRRPQIGVDRDIACWPRRRSASVPTPPTTARPPCSPRSVHDVSRRPPGGAAAAAAQPMTQPSITATQIADKVHSFSIVKGADPDPVGVTCWSQPWVPLWLEWEVELPDPAVPSIDGWTLGSVDLEGASADEHDDHPDRPGPRPAHHRRRDHAEERCRRLAQGRERPRRRRPAVRPGRRGHRGGTRRPGHRRHSGRRGDCRPRRAAHPAARPPLRRRRAPRRQRRRRLTDPVPVAPPVLLEAGALALHAAPACSTRSGAPSTCPSTPPPSP